MLPTYIFFISWMFLPYLVWTQHGRFPIDQRKDGKTDEPVDLENDFGREKVFK